MLKERFEQTRTQERNLGMELVRVTEPELRKDKRPLARLFLSQACQSYVVLARLFFLSQAC
jgi:hypothetical protein